MAGKKAKKVLTPEQLAVKLAKLEKQKQKLVRKAEQKDSQFYFLIDNKNLPRGTVCLTTEQGIVSRGISLCSMKTTLPSPEEGAYLAWCNAKRAMSKNADQYKINRPEAKEVIKNFKSKLWDKKWKHRCQFDVLPSNGVEEKIFNKLLDINPKLK